MHKELEYYKLEAETGFNQDYFTDYWMKLGGCAAVTAMDMSIYLDRSNDEKKLYPLLDEIELMRKELEDKRILRDKLQSRINSTYSFIHGFMGGKETERFDEHMLE